MFYEVLKLCRRTVYFGSTYAIWIYAMEVYASVCAIVVYFFLHLQRTLLKVELATVSTSKLRDSTIVDSQSFTKIGTPFVDDHFHHVHGF